MLEVRRHLLSDLSSGASNERASIEGDAGVVCLLCSHSVGSHKRHLCSTDSSRLNTS